MCTCRLLREGVVLDIANVKRCCVELIGDVTFQEAYQRTGTLRVLFQRVTALTLTAVRSGRTLNVTVSHATRLKKGTRLLNHLTAPRVVVWSAACASCAVPGLFKPVTILAKSHDGDLVPFEPTAQQYVDGSYLNDLPIVRRFAVTPMGVHTDSLPNGGRLCAHRTNSASCSAATTRSCRR